MKQCIHLQNGLVLITHKNTHITSAAFTVYFAIGSAYENNQNRGITHLVEHMFFRKLNNLTQKEFYLKAESLSGNVNGYTTREYVCFTYSVLAEYASEAFDLMTNFLEDFLWTEEEIEKEKQVILRELDLFGFSTDSAYEYYSGDIKCYKNNCSYFEHITAFEVNAWKKKYFCCNNACFVITGNFDIPQSAICQKLNKYKSSKKSIAQKKFKPNKLFVRTNKDYRFPPFNGNVADVRVFFDIPISNQYDWIKAQVIHDIFACGNSSRLSFALKDTFAYTEDVYADITAHNGYATMDINWRVDNAYLLESLDEFFRQLSQIKENISKDEFYAALPFSTLNVKKCLDDPNELGARYGYFDFICNIPYSIETAVNAWDTLTIEDIGEALEKTLDINNMFVCVANNKKQVRRRELKEFFDSQLQQSQYHQSGDGSMIDLDKH